MADETKYDISEVLITEEQLKKRVKELGKEITEDYKGEELFLIGILKGSVPFMADLMRRIDIPVEIDFMVVSSYGSGTQSLSFAATMLPAASFRQSSICATSAGLAHAALSSASALKTRGSM